MMTPTRVLRLAKRLVKTTLGREIWVSPDVKIPIEQHGTDYGGWAIASGRLGPDSIIYSVGIGEDLSFDLSVAEKFGCQIHAFDPTPRSLKWVRSQRLDPRIRVHEVGLAASDGDLVLREPPVETHVSYSVIREGEGALIRCPVESLPTIRKRLGHWHIDLLKMDIEGAEYEVIESLRTQDVLPRQLLVEFHHRIDPAGVARTRRALGTLRDLGYQLFNVSDRGEEYSFIHKTALEGLA